MLTLNLPPMMSRSSIALSFLTAMVRPGGSKLAWLIHEASMALLASSSLAVTTAREPTTLPMASWLPEAMTALGVPGGGSGGVGGRAGVDGGPGAGREQGWDAAAVQSECGRR